MATRTRASSSAKHGRFFPGAQTFDDIIDQLAQRMAAMQSLMRSMSPEQRAELKSMMEALLRDDRLLVDLAQLASNLDLLLPGGLGDRVPFGGDEPLGLEGALVPDRPAPGDGPARRRPVRRRDAGDLAALDRNEVRDLLGDDAVRDLDALDDLARRLEEAGYLTRDGERLELTPRGSRVGSARRCSTTCSRGSSATRSVVTGSTAAGGEGSATRRPSRTSSATRSISTCAGRCSTRSAARRTHRRRERPPATAGSTSCRPTSRSTGPNS